MSDGLTVADIFREQCSIVLSESAPSITFLDLDELYIYEREAFTDLVSEKVKKVNAEQEKLTRDMESQRSQISRAGR